MTGVRDRIGDLIGEDATDLRWRDHLGELLYESETVRETVDVEDARVVVTSHRVLVFDPGADGKQFRQIDRPNVRRVATGTESEGDLLVRGARWIVGGGVLALAGTLIEVESFVGDVSPGGGAGAGGVGLGGVLGVVQRMLDLLRQLDELLQLAGGLVLLLGGVALGAHLLTRDPRLVVEVAGDGDDVSLPRPADSRAVVERLETAIFPDGTWPTHSSDGDPLPEA